MLQTHHQPQNHKPQYQPTQPARPPTDQADMLKGSG